MLCKLLRGEESESVQAFSWGETAGSAPHRPPASAPPGSPQKGPAADSEAVRLLEQKLAQARTEMERRVREAQEAGFRQGEAAGRKAAQQQVDAAVEKLGAAIAQLAQYKDRLRASAEADLVRLSMAIARRVLNRELSLDPEALLGIVRTGMEKLRASETARVRLHPDYRARVQAFLERSGVERLEVAADASLDRGGVVFETARGRLDVSMETQLQEIERGLADRVGGDRR